MIGQHAGAIVHDTGHIGAGVDHRIPAPLAGQALKAGVILPVATDHLDPEHVAAGPATVEGSDLVTVSQCLLNERTPEEPGPTQHQQPHRTDPPAPT